MIVDIPKALIEFLKLAPRYLIALSLAAAFLLFAPDKFIQRIGVLELTQNHRPVLGVTLVVSASICFVSIGGAGATLLKKWWGTRKFYRRAMKRLHCLNEDEKQILRFYLVENTRANSLRIDDGVVQGLVAEGIIYRSTSVGYMTDGFAHNIRDFAWDYLKKHQSLLDGTTNTYRTDKTPDLF